MNNLSKKEKYQKTEEKRKVNKLYNKIFEKDCEINSLAAKLEEFYENNEWIENDSESCPFEINEEVEILKAELRGRNRIINHLKRSINNWKRLTKE